MIHWRQRYIKDVRFSIGDTGKVVKRQDRRHVNDTERTADTCQEDWIISQSDFASRWYVKSIRKLSLWSTRWFLDIKTYLQKQFKGKGYLISTWGCSQAGFCDFWGFLPWHGIDVIWQLKAFLLYPFQDSLFLSVIYIPALSPLLPKVDLWPTFLLIFYTQCHTCQKANIFKLMLLF